MRNTLILLVLGTLISGSAVAFSPIATVTSAEPFVLDGQPVATSGSSSLPLALGSEVATSNAPAVLFFTDGSSVKLAAASHAKLIGSEGHPKLVLLSGSLDYKVVLGSKLSVTSLDLERKTKPAAQSVSPATKPVQTPQTDRITLTVVER